MTQPAASVPGGHCRGRRPTATQYRQYQLPGGGLDSGGEQHAQCQQVEQPSHTSMRLVTGESYSKHRSQGCNAVVLRRLGSIAMLMFGRWHRLKLLALSLIVRVSLPCMVMMSPSTWTTT